MARRGFSPFVDMWTQASEVDGGRRFFATTGAMDVAGVKEVNCAAEIYNMTANMRGYFGLQVSDDTEAWPDASTFTLIGSSYRNSAGLWLVEGYADIAEALVKPFWRAGLVVRNDTNSNLRIEFWNASTRFLPRGC